MTHKQPPVKVAMIGLGWWARKMTAVLQKAKGDIEVVCAAEPDAARSGKFGRLLQVEANFSHDKFLSLDSGNWRLNAAEAPVGGMTATGIHLTDLSAALFGPARDVRVACENLGSDFPQGDTMS